MTVRFLKTIQLGSKGKGGQSGIVLRTDQVLRSGTVQAAVASSGVRK